MALRTYTFTGWTWSAVFAGVIASLIFQVLLIMIGYGVGLLTIDVPTADSAPRAVSWAVFAWWAVSGVISAFVGGWVAAHFSEAFTAEARATHGLMAWALATLIVVGAAGLAAESSLASNLVGPTGTVLAQYQRLSDARAPTPRAPATANIEAARRNLAIAMIGSFFALLFGAGAAVAGSQWLPETMRTTGGVGSPRGMGTL
ncbi:MAG: hypothetical protein QOF19_325 [Alphaproteobacteria bacterium]|jgi:hypothetical protein|nr:hypothetical protein [Alphaproteobacteria bacterium]MEA2992030.1 hypothetical protein [Alphaproteobacteria bacterium]